MRWCCEWLVVWLWSENWRIGGWCWVASGECCCWSESGKMFFKCTTRSGKWAVMVPSGIVIARGLAVRMIVEQRI